MSTEKDVVVYTSDWNIYTYIYILYMYRNILFWLKRFIRGFFSWYIALRLFILSIFKPREKLNDFVHCTSRHYSPRLLRFSTLAFFPFSLHSLPSPSSSSLFSSSFPSSLPSLFCFFLNCLKESCRYYDTSLLNTSACILSVRSSFYKTTMPFSHTKN